MSRKLNNLPVILGRNHSIPYYGLFHSSCVEGKDTEWERALSKMLLDQDVQIEINPDLPLEPALLALFIPVRVAWATHKKLWILCHKKNSGRIITFATKAISVPTMYQV